MKCVCVCNVCALSGRIVRALMLSMISQTVSIFSTSGITKDSIGGCQVLQTIPIDVKTCQTPHELAVDQENGFVYVTCVGTNTPGFLRLMPVA